MENHPFLKMKQDWEKRFCESQESVRLLEEELADTSRGVLVLTMELERRVDERTTELRSAQEELQKTNSDLLQLTLELEDRVAERTSELQKKDEEVRVMSQQLWQAAKLATMGELAASIAHELNNPLATVGLRLESLLAQAPEGDPKRKSLEIVAQEVERMAELVANLLQFSRRSQQHISTVNLIDEIEQTVGLIHYHLRKGRISVAIQIAEDLPLINADRQQLRQLFLNLFTNAADACPQGGSIRISAATDKPTSSVVIEIADSGLGIQPDLLQKVFEPFFTTKPEGKGTGLGLAICRRIVQEHKGRIEVSSEGAPGKGAIFRIYLPLKNGINGGYLKG